MSNGDEVSPPRRGRPPKAGEGKRASFNTRLRESLKRDLEAAAEAAGRSLSEEIEDRLERSFERGRERTFREALANLLGGPRTEAILVTLAMFTRWDPSIGDDA